MIWRLIAVVGAAVLLLPASASAKLITRFLVVGANGRSVSLGAGWRLYEQIRPQGNATVAAPSGSYLLFYPLMESGLPIEPARYYPDSRVACWSWTLARSECVAPTRLPATWPRTRVLTSFRQEPTILASLSHDGVSYTLPSNSSVVIELALLRTRLARPAPRSACPWSLDARWQGPASATRPTSLCLRANGVSAGGRLYPLTPAAADMLHSFS
jgi:hypothetical protein